jgi:hypothetical protein
MHTYGKRVQITVPALSFILRMACEHGPLGLRNQFTGAVSATKATGTAALESGTVMRLFREVAGQDVSESTAEQILVFLASL